MTFKKLALVAALFASQAAFAAEWPDNAFYAGVGVGQGKLKGDAADYLHKLPGSTFDDKDTVGKVFIGKQFNRNFALEGSYNYLGHYTAERAPFEYAGAQARSLGLDAVLTLPLTQKFGVLGRVGIERTRGNVTYNAFEESDTSYNPKFGVGLEYKFTPKLAVRGEFERHRVKTEDIKTRVNTTMVSLVYKFGAPAYKRTTYVAPAPAPTPAPVYTAPAPTPAPAVEAPVTTTKKVRE